MNEAIELHDSKLAAVTWAGDAAQVVLCPAYIHRSSGQPGSEAGTGWLQEATLTVSAASVSGRIASPTIIADGVLRVGGELHDGFIPASGTFDGPIELNLLLATSENVRVSGERLTIALLGDAVYLEDVDL